MLARIKGLKKLTMHAVRVPLRITCTKIHSTTEDKSHSVNKSDLAIVKHMDAFADESGLVTEASCYKAFTEKFRMKEDAARSLAKNTMFLAWYCSIPGVKVKARSLPFPGNIVGSFKPIDGIGKLMHPHDTGFFTMAGDFNNKFFDTIILDRPEDPSTPLPKDKLIADRDPTDPNIQIIFKSSLEDYMVRNCQKYNAPRWDHASFFFKQIGKLGNKGEFDIMINSPATSIERLNKEGKSERCIRVDDLKAFYADTNKYFVEKVTDGFLKKDAKSEQETTQKLAMR